jgi:hypothetical protein
MAVAVDIARMGSRRQKKFGIDHDVGFEGEIIKFRRRERDGTDGLFSGKDEV